MGKNSSIEWTHHTFNPWWGCSKVSEACRNCYAEAWSKRTGSNLWGQSAERRFFSDRHWNEPMQWHQEAERLRMRKRVFCASMADILEDREDLIPWRNRLWELIHDTPWLDWLLLTKRPQNLGKMNPWGSAWPRNLWLGTTVENQRIAEERIPILLRYPVTVRFVSCEPLLASINLIQWLKNCKDKDLHVSSEDKNNRIDWVIVGGESGHKARPIDPYWVRNIRDQCLATSIPFHFKQWGTWCPVDNSSSIHIRTMVLERTHGSSIILAKMGKKKAGRELDGRIWDQVPEVHHSTNFSLCILA
jgi:protein gp37